MPTSIVSDRDSKFTSHFWQATFKAIGTQLRMSTDFHPQTDGEAERVKRILEDMLRMYVNEKQNNWAEYLSLVELHITVHGTHQFVWLLLKLCMGIVVRLLSIFPILLIRLKFLNKCLIKWMKK